MTLSFLAALLLTAPAHAAIEKVACDGHQPLAALPPAAAKLATDAYAEASFTLTRVGTLEGVDQYRLESASYGKRPFFYTLAADGNTLTFSSAQAYFYTDKARTILLDSPTHGVSYRTHSTYAGYEGPGGTVTEYGVYRNCVVTN